ADAGQFDPHPRVVAALGVVAGDVRAGPAVGHDRVGGRLPIGGGGPPVGDVIVLDHEVRRLALIDRIAADDLDAHARQAGGGIAGDDDITALIGDAAEDQPDPLIVV